MKYLQKKEEALVFALEKVEEAAEALEEVLSDTAEEMAWFRENLQEELLSVRTEKMAMADSAKYYDWGSIA